MIGKLIVHAESRDGAISRMRGALDEFAIGPIRTTIPLHRRVMDHRRFVEANLDIHYISEVVS